MRNRDDLLLCEHCSAIAKSWLWSQPGVWHKAEQLPTQAAATKFNSHQTSPSTPALAEPASSRRVERDPSHRSITASKLLPPCSKAGSSSAPFSLGPFCLSRKNSIKSNGQAEPFCESLGAWKWFGRTFASLHFRLAENLWCVLLTPCTTNMFTCAPCTPPAVTFGWL